jgi:hypothetical protein
VTAPATPYYNPFENSLSFEQFVLGQLVESFSEDGDTQIWALMLDATDITLQRNPDNWLELSHVVVHIEPHAHERIAADTALCDKIRDRLAGLLRSHGSVPVVIDIERRLPLISETWRTDQESRLRSEGLTNQARAVRSDASYPREDGLSFRSQQEVTVYRTLRQLQTRAPDELKFAVFPLPAGRIPAGNIWEPDFLITVNKRAGLIEVDGPHHRGRLANDVTRDRLWFSSGIAAIERILVEDTEDTVALQTLLARFISRLART